MQIPTVRYADSCFMHDSKKSICFLHFLAHYIRSSTLDGYPHTLRFSLCHTYCSTIYFTEAAKIYALETWFSSLSQTCL